VLGALAGCAAPGSGPDPAPTLAYPGEAEFYLEPYDAQGACSVTVGLRNSSGVRQGDAWLSLAWYGTEGALVAEQRLRLDPLLEGRYDAKNLTLPVRCTTVARVVVRSARWRVFPTKDGPDPGLAPEARIDAVDGREWRFGWQAGSGLFVGEASGS
jgi:hypothetical protein